MNHQRIVEMEYRAARELRMQKKHKQINKTLEPHDQI